MEKSVPYEDTGLLLGISKNTVIGHSTVERGRVYVPENNGVPYPDGMVNLIKARIKLADKKTNSPDSNRKKAAEEEIKELKEHYMVIIKGATYEDFIKYIDSIRKSSETRESKEKGLLKKVLETGEKEKIPKPPQKPAIEDEKEPTTYHSEVDYEAQEIKDKKNKKSEQKPSSLLTERELNTPLDDLADLTLKKIYELKKSIERNPSPEKQEQLNKLEVKYRQIGVLYHQGYFKQNG
jgi:hypothetical protein